MKRENGLLTGLLYVLMVFLAVGLAILVFFNYQANTEQMAAIEAEELAAAVTPTPEPTATPAPTAVPERNTETVTLAFAGDIVGQPGLTTEAASQDGDVVSYDYTEELLGVSRSLEGSDLAACTLVGTLSGKGPFDEGYRMSNDMTAALAGVGFQVVNAATDHILDDGVDGLVSTVETLSLGSLAAVGAYRSEQLHGIFMAQVRGVNVAVLSYTYGTGGVSVADEPWCVDILTQDYMTGQETVDYERIDADVAAAKSGGADIVVCFVYWWDNTQYYTAARSNQTEVVEHMFQNGVDIVIGSGVKTPQPIETRTVERADGTTANCVVCYSLSNLMSCFSDVYTNLSATVKIEVCRDVDTGEVWISGVSYDPLFMLDTGDYSDYESPSFKYRLLDAYSAMEAFESGGKNVSSETYDAIVEGVESLRSILGVQYDSAGGGALLVCPY